MSGLWRYRSDTCASHGYPESGARLDLHPAGILEHFSSAASFVGFFIPSLSEEHVLVVDGSLAPPVQRLQFIVRVPVGQEGRQRVGVAEQVSAAHGLAPAQGNGSGPVWKGRGRAVRELH